MSENRARIDGGFGFRMPWARLAGVGVLLASMSVLAQGGPGGVRPYRLPPNLLQYFKARYVTVNESSAFRLKETPDGPLGDLHLYGAIRPAVNRGGDTPEERARSIALAFIEQEAAILDIPDLAEIREFPFKVRDDGRANISFYRYIGGLRLMYAYISITIDADGAIRSVNASLTPVSSDVYWAVKRETISPERAMKIVEDDLTRRDQKFELTIEEPAKVATWLPPYVVWGVLGARRGTPLWAYSIDAFTGKILGRECTESWDMPPYGPVCD